ncbi:MAG TPA: hypothetical protein VFN24_01550 [Microbacterium sp.]|nr:hypothetical protein [Microbacterium sp.]
MRRVSLRVCALLAVVAAALTGCVPSVSSAGLPDGVTVSFEQLRSDVAARQAEVRIRNDSTHPLLVESVSVADPRFDGLAERVLDHTSTVAAGAIADIRVQLPPMTCPAPDDATATATIAYTLDGVDGSATAPLPDRLSFLPPLHERECRAAALAQAADVAFTAFTASDAGAPGELTLTVTPTGAAAMELTGLSATNLLRPVLPGESGGVWPLHVTVAQGDTAPVVVRLPIEPLRCDAHAVMEDKRGTVFRLETVIDGDAGQVEIAADDVMRGRLLAWVAHWCGYGP